MLKTKLFSIFVKTRDSVENIRKMRERVKRVAVQGPSSERGRNRKAEGHEFHSLPRKKELLMGRCITAASAHYINGAEREILNGRGITIAWGFFAIIGRGAPR
ncbi:hypothetical protein CEXT_269441 [Caerostris extrusa]|uniref:Uncharacterized protein n=1 Tax=Caerostris extrusa TaxID=172846 RepID=A0AAV4SAV8_CAEEX|nr:hypothetical protein CEXT_269441 [Caerostris extrusa]